LLLLASEPEEANGRKIFYEKSRLHLAFVFNAPLSGE
jgi:hypothetical protein